MTITINGSGTITGASTLATTTVSQNLTTPVVTSTIGVGNATPSGSGSGITFPATQSASSDANTLDDYEEGTFTPSIATDATQPTVTYTARGGGYIKVGTLVYFSMRIVVSTISGGTGALNLAGLPFTAIDASGGGGWGYQAVSIGYTAGWTAGTTPYNALVFQNSTNVRPYYTATLGGNKTDNNISQVAGGMEIYVAGCYRTS